MASLFRDRSLGQSKRESMTGASSCFTSSSSSASSTFAAMATMTISSSLPSPFGNLTLALSAADLRGIAYEIFVAACRTSSGKPLTYIPSNSSSQDRSPSPSPSSLSSSPFM
ncbi:hypothetical protein NMG60_11008389 [Bertholletia excelsa]